MDLGAYANIDNFGFIMRENGIHVPRLRGLRLMKNEIPLTKEEIDHQINFCAMYDCETLCSQRFRPNLLWYEFSSATRRLMNKYLIYNESNLAIGVNWKNVHGKKRKMFKYVIKKNKKVVKHQLGVYNSYCGKDDVLYIHARIGGPNWLAYGGDEIEKQPWFIEKVDDAFDCTYCDIYARIK